MRTYYFISVYILTDSQGELWEWLNTDDDTRRFKPGTAELFKTKEFKTADLAKKHAEKLDLKRFKVIKSDPPVKPSITWGQTVIYDIDNREKPQILTSKAVIAAKANKIKHLGD